MQDFVREFNTPGTKLARKGLGMPRTVTGFMLEDLVNRNASSAIRRLPPSRIIALFRVAFCLAAFRRG